MSQVTLDQALELVVPWIGTTYAAGFSRDELAMEVLRKLQDGTEVAMFDEDSRTQVMVPDVHEPELWYDGSRWNCRTDSWAEAWQAPDPRDAIIIAAGMWLQSQSKP